MADIIGGILAGPEVDNYHHVSNDFTSTEEEVKYVNELTKLLTGIVGDPLEDYLKKDEVKRNITHELGGINEANLVVAELVKGDSGFDLSTLSRFFSSHTDFQEMFMGDAVVEELTNVGTFQPTTAAVQSRNALHTEHVAGNPTTSAEQRRTGEVVTQRTDLSGGFRKTNKRRNKKGRKRSKGTRKK